jgi:anti-sigma factor RsiW
MNTCDTIRPRLAEYVVGALETSAREEVRKHLAVCPACSAEVRELEQVGQWLDDAVLEAPPPFLWTRIRAQLEEPQANPVATWWQGWWRWPRTIYAGVAAVLLVGALVFWIMSPAPNPRGESASADAYVVQHHLSAWHDPLQDKAIAGLWLVEKP